MYESDVDSLDVRVRFNPAFEEFFRSPKFFKVLYGSAGSGKSFSVAQKIIKRLVEEQGHHAWCFRKVSTFIPESVFAALLEVIDSFGVRHLVKVNKTNRTIAFTNGNMITCAGLDDQEKIKSIAKMTIAWVEETTEFDEQDIDQIGLRMRGESPVLRELIMTFNPVSELHWLKAKFFDDVTPELEKRLFLLHTTYKDNAFLGEEYVSRLESMYLHDENLYRIYVLGAWGRMKTGQEYYKWFSFDHHTDDNVAYNPNYPLHISWDFNVLPYMSMTIWQVERRTGTKIANTEFNHPEWWQAKGIAEIAGQYPNNSTEAMCYHFLDNWADKLRHGVIIYGDATGKARHSSSKQTDYSIIKELLKSYILDFKVPRSNPIPMDVHSFMNRMMYGSLPIHMVINPSMKYTIQDLTHVLEDGERRKVKQASRDPISKQTIEKFGHMSDSMDYFFMEAFKQYRV